MTDDNSFVYFNGAKNSTNKYVVVVVVTETFECKLYCPEQSYYVAFCMFP